MQIFSVHIDIEGALNLETKKLCWEDNGKNNWKHRYWRSGIVLTTITTVITIVSWPEFLLFKVWCLISFGNVITRRAIFKGWRRLLLGHGDEVERL